jgi:membrane fusion protein (multidrug efflux system)
MRAVSIQRVAAVLLPFVVAACSGGSAAQGPGPGGGMPPAAVAVAPVQAAELSASFEYVGQAAGSREVEVRARVPGILLERKFKEGTTVRRGQSLYTVDPAPLRASLDRADADVASAQARLAMAQRTLARLEPLYKAKAVSQREYDDAASAEQIARADLKGAQARRAESALSMQYTRVEAPITGLAARSLASEGTLVPGPELLLTTIVQTDPIKIRFAIADTDQLRWRAESKAGRLVLPKDGAFDVEVTTSDGRTLERRGKLLFTDTRVSEQTGTHEAEAEIANPDGALKPGQFVRVRLLGAKRPNAVQVPTRAVLEGPQGKFVYLAVDGKAQPRPVQVGEQLGDKWLVTEGLKPGDPVIIDGVMRIGPGAPVQTAPPAAASAPAAAASK